MKQKWSFCHRSETFNYSSSSSSLGLLICVTVRYLRKHETPTNKRTDLHKQISLIYSLGEQLMRVSVREFDVIICSCQYCNRERESHWADADCIPVIISDERIMLYSAGAKILVIMLLISDLGLERSLTWQILLVYLVLVTPHPPLPPRNPLKE